MLNRPNIVLITTDQQRYDSLGCNGNHFIHTPHSDSLAKEGARFTRAYCSNPVCTPSRVSIMTGQQVSKHGSYNIGTIAQNIPDFLSSILTKEGYRSHHIGKAHFYPWDQPSEENRPTDGINPFVNFAGFQTAEVSVGHSDWGVNGHYEAWLKTKGIQKGCKMKELQVQRLFEDDAYGTGDWGMPKAYQSGSWIVERAKHFLKEQEESASPFFLNIGFQDPHHPQVLPPDCERISPEVIPHSTGSFDKRLEHLLCLGEGTIEESRFSGPFKIAGNQNTPWLKHTNDQERMAIIKSYYYSMVELFDEQLGHLIDLLKPYSLWENTIMIVTSDHGDMLGYHQLGEKGPMSYEDVIRIPLLISYPREIASKVISQPISLIDLFPTILDYCNIEIPQKTDGISLRPRLSGTNSTTSSDTSFQREWVLIEFKEERDAIRYKCFVTEEWKLTEYPGEPFGELYHLSEDPQEEHNLYFELPYLPIKYELLKKMLSYIEKQELLAPRPCRC